MKAAGAAILGAAVVGLGVLAAKQASASQDDGSDVDFDIDKEEQLATNYYAMAVTHPDEWSSGQLKSLETLLNEFGMIREAANIRDMRLGLYGDTPNSTDPPIALPDIFFIPPSQIEEMADDLEGEL